MTFVEQRVWIGLALLAAALFLFAWMVWDCRTRRTSGASVETGASGDVVAVHNRAHTSGFLAPEKTQR